MMRLPFGLVALCLATSAIAADPPNSGFDDKFRQLDELLPTPTTVRTASGAPGHAYWQQRADYTIRATLDEAHRSISGAETINYHNNSPDSLNYLWVQLDQNIFKPDSDAHTTATVASRDAWGKPHGPEDGMKFDSMRNMLEARTFAGGFRIAAVKDGRAIRSTTSLTAR